jgi:hypothetical protein
MMDAGMPASMSDPEQLPGMPLRRSGTSAAHKPASGAPGSGLGSGWGDGSGGYDQGLATGIEEGEGDDDGDGEGTEELPDTPPDKQYRSRGLGLGDLGQD